MKITGIIAEYNPFHNGHKYQLSKAKEVCDAVVTVMSGSVTQRGTISYFDKFVRARAAVLSGVDLVVELPTCYTLSSAELFAKGAVSVFDSMGIINNLHFGSESGDIAELEKYADIMLSETPKISQSIKAYLKSGIGYPQARQLAYSEMIPSDVLESPNNILGIEYIKALKTQNSKISPVTIKRTAVGHNEVTPNGNVLSATGIRDMLADSKNVARFVPKEVAGIYNASKKFDKSIYDSIVMYNLKVCGMNIFNNIFDASPELVARILKAVTVAKTLDELLEKASSKQFTKARIRRVILSAALGINAELTYSAPEYIRVLAFNDSGREIINELQKKSKLPIITKTADYSGRNSDMFSTDVRATELSSICRGVAKGLDFTKSPIYIKPYNEIK